MKTVRGNGLSKTSEQGGSKKKKNQNKKDGGDKQKEGKIEVNYQKVVKKYEIVM